MDVKSIHLINSQDNLDAADVLIRMEDNSEYVASIKKIDLLLEQIKNGKTVNSSLQYIYVPESLIVAEISEDYLFDMVHHLFDDGNFYSVFKKV